MLVYFIILIILIKSVQHKQKFKVTVTERFVEKDKHVSLCINLKGNCAISLERVIPLTLEKSHFSISLISNKSISQSVVNYQNKIVDKISMMRIR